MYMKNRKQRNSSVVNIINLRANTFKGVVKAITNNVIGWSGEGVGKIFLRQYSSRLLVKCN